LIQIALSLLKLGGLARHIPKAVIWGFMAGAGLLEALTQMPTVLGLRLAGAGADHVPYRLWLTCSRGGPVDVYSLAISLGTVAVVCGLHRLNGRLNVRIPFLLLSLILISLLVGLLNVAPPEGPIGGLHVASALPTPQLPALPPGWVQQLRPIGGGALAIAFLGLVEALAMASALAARSEQPLDYDRQCLAEGLANFGGGLFGCLPGSGSLSRSAINFYSGAATRWSGVFSAAAVAAALWLFAPLARFVPPPALAGVLLWTAWHVIDPQRLWVCVRSSRAAAALSTAFAAVVVGIQFAIFAGIASSLLCRKLMVCNPVGGQPVSRSASRCSPALARPQEVVLHARTDRSA
jgi:SulP family sulfate permease